MYNIFKTCCQISGRKYANDAMLAALSIVVILTVILPTANAANFGSAAKSDHIKIMQGDEANFSLLFWTTDEGAQDILLFVISSPWSVTFEKASFNISRSQGNEMIFSGGYIHATSIAMAADARAAENGTYQIIVSAKSTATGGDMSIAQERIFNLSVDVLPNNNEANAGDIQGQYASIAERNETGKANGTDSANENTNVNQNIAGIISIAALVILAVIFMLEVAHN